MNTQDMPVLQLRGTARERGLAHGEALRPQIAALVCEVKHAIGAKAGMHPDAYFDEFIASLPLWESMPRLDPAFREEIEAIAQASNQRFADIAVLNLLDEEIWYGRARLMTTKARGASNPAPGQTPHDKCTAVAAVESGTTLLGQNMDIATWTDGKQALLHVRPEGTDLEYYAFSCAGILALCGVNNRGLGICVNNLMHLDPAPDGRPVISTVGALLASDDIDAAARILKSSRHASGQCYTLGQRGRIAGFECSATQCIEYSVWPSLRRLVHANHAFANVEAADARNLRERGLEMGLPRFYFDVTKDSRARQAEMQRLFGDASKPVALESIKLALAQTEEGEYPICRTGENDANKRNFAFTTGSLIWQLDDATTAHVAAGPPDRSEYRQFKF